MTTGKFTYEIGILVDFTDDERGEDCRTIVAALNIHLNDSPVLLIDETGALTRVAAIDDDIIAAVSNGIMDAIRFHEGEFPAVRRRRGQMGCGGLYPQPVTLPFSREGPSFPPSAGPLFPFRGVSHD